ncbi:MAG TPA: DNA (cytosine-5-)-methyltransferase, partial [Pseudomonas sp.]|nr:DNA (cytosine-5-)-methyltransferase [Pseudomonas sp.]
VASGPEGEWHPSALVEAYGKLSKRAQSSWEWWRLPAPPARTSIFADLVEDKPHGVTWHTAAETKKLLGMMNPLNLAKVEAAKKAGGRQVGTIYKRTRADGPNGEKVQRAEIRFDDVAGCLRTCRFQKTAALNVRSRLHYSSGGVGSIRQRRAAAGQ